MAAEQTMLSKIQSGEQQRGKMKQDYTADSQMPSRDFMSSAHKKDPTMLHYAKLNAQNAADRKSIETGFSAIM